ncbi:MAG: hypothetical protein P8M78_04300 [Myxococcota bacterium]|nr:hypothetical protein [Myxococcota bacterium]
MTSITVIPPVVPQSDRNASGFVRVETVRQEFADRDGARSRRWLEATGD